VRKLGILAGFVILLTVFGAGSAGLLPSVPFLVQTADPNASPMMATPEQANQLLFWIVFVLINLIGAGVTLTIVMWFLGRATNHARNLPNNPPAILNRPAEGEGQGLPASSETKAQLSEGSA
jgi:hypothetical protein